MPSIEQESPKKKRLRLALRWGIYLTLCIFLLNEATDSAEVQECIGVDASVAAMSHSDYRTLVKYGIPDPPQPQKVVLVTIGPAEPDEIKSNYCAQRLFVARLVERLKRLNVAVIALDKSYESGTCPIAGDETKALVAAISGSSPVVTLAERTRLLPKQQREDPHVCLQLRRGFNLGLPPENLGVARLDADTRRIPLKWPLLAHDQNDPSSAETFAYVTARAANRAALETPLLRNALRQMQQPYSTMTKIPSHSALEVLCGKSPDALEWRTCNSSVGVEGMNGAVAVIGDHFSDQDTHPVMRAAEDMASEANEDSAPEGMVYGVDLQANYIAALLDRRYYLPLLTDFEDKVFIVAFFVVLQILFWKCKQLWIAVLIGAGLWVLIFVASLEILAFTRYLLTVWVHGINLATIVVTWLEHWVAKME